MAWASPRSRARIRASRLVVALALRVVAARGGNAVGSGQAMTDFQGTVVVAFLARNTRDLHMRPMGWLISVQAPVATYRPLYATVANTHEQAKDQVCDYCSITNETIRL